MEIIIDLSLLEKFGIDINEYLAICKIHKLSIGKDIPFTVDCSDIGILKEKGFLEEKDGNLFITDKSEKLLQIKEDEITDIINYFKEVTGKNRVSTTSASNRSFINQRLKQGYKSEDLKNVIDVMNKEWSGTSMAEYIRIETLFNETKFQKYINKVDSNKNIIENKSNFRRI